LGYKVAKYNEGGLIAPNGKPSNLNEEHNPDIRFHGGGEIGKSETFYERTYADGTKNRFSVDEYEKKIYPKLRFDGGGNVNTNLFEKWFNNSKVVDKKGNPLIVYHGSPDLRGLKEKYIFESRFADNQSFFFTDNYSMAKSYADPQRAFDYQNAEEGVIGLYLSLQNPLIVNAFNQIWRKFETIIDGNEIIGTRNLIKFAKDKGYDGVIVENVRDYYNNNENKTKGGNVYVAFEPTQIKLADGSNTTFDSNNPDIRFDNGGNINDNNMSNTRTLTRQEVEYMQRIINDPLVSPKLKESFKKVLDSRKVPENADFSRFPEGKYIDPYDFSGYEYMKSRNEEMGVSFLLTGEYELVSKAIFERDYAMWLFYNYLGRVNISFANCQLWIKEAQASFINEMPIQVGLTHQPKAKDGRSYAMWYTCGESQKVISESRLGVKLTFEYNGRWYCNEIGMVGNYDYKGTGWGTYYEEKKTGLLVPEYTETSFHLTTLIHEFAHCFDFQSQLLANIEKYKNKKFDKENKEVDVNTEEMTELEKQLYGASLKDKPLSVSNPITNHFDYFIDSLIKVLRQCASGKIPLTQKFEQQALDVQTALEGTYGDLLLAQREKRRKDAIATQKMDEMRDNTRFTWQGKIISEFMKYVEKFAMQKEILESLSKKGNQRSFNLSEIIELDNLISQYAKTEFLVFASKNPSKSQALYNDLKDLKVETNRIINNHYDNIRRDYEYGFIPNTDLDKYLRANCDVRDFRDYKSWKECNQSKLSEKMR